MDRRDLLKLGALASVGNSGCASLISNPGAVGAGRMDDFLASFDATMAAIGGTKFLQHLLPASPGDELQARANAGEVLSRQMYRSMFLVGTLQELPAEQRAHPGVQQRLRDSLGEMDDAVFGMTSMLEGLTPSERTHVSKALRDDPNLGMQIMGSVDEQAAGFGVSLKQRTKLRALSAQACARLKQSPDLAIAEYTGKVRKVQARHGARAEAERRTAAAIGSALLWQGDDGAPGAVGGEAPSSPPPKQGASYDSCRTSADCRPGLACVGTRELRGGQWDPGLCKSGPADPTPSDRIVTAGAIIMGLGLAAVGVGGLIQLTGTSYALAVGVTVGAILGIIGLVVLIIGGIVTANERAASQRLR